MKSEKKRYFEENESADDCGLSWYEVRPCEPLQNLKGHIYNKYAALPSKLTKTQLQVFNATLVACYGSKSKVRGSEYQQE